MLPIMLRITLGVGLVLYFTVILLFLKYKAIELKYTLIWIFCGVAMLLMVIFPKLLTFLLNPLGIVGTMNGLFILFIAFSNFSVKLSNISITFFNYTKKPDLSPVLMTHNVLFNC